MTFGSPWLAGAVFVGSYVAKSSYYNQRRRGRRGMLGVVTNEDINLKVITPPYFLRAYGETARMVNGTWRTYTQ